MNNEDLQQLKALALAATPGPWEATRQTDEECQSIGYFIEAGNKTISDDGTAPDDGDAVFIAAANPSAVLALIERIESLAAPAVANAASWELPPLPVGVGSMTNPFGDGGVYGRRDMEAYARAAIAAAAPNAALVAALQQCLIEFDNIEVPEGGLNGYDSLLHAEAAANAALAAHAGQGAKV